MRKTAHTFSYPALRARPALTAALAIFILASATVGGAWIFQAFGFTPCELCLKERLPYYAGIAVAGFAILFAWQNMRGAVKACLAVLFLIFAASAVFGAYHAGVEWKFWPGPSDCTGSFQAAHSPAEFLQQLKSIKVVRCDDVAIRILGLSLAGWNAVISLALAVWALYGLRNKVNAL
jgi:disulfide bond formation protein DsbB